jgi:hypothetical protein
MRYRQLMKAGIQLPIKIRTYMVILLFTLYTIRVQDFKFSEQNDLKEQLLTSNQLTNLLKNSNSF